MAELLLKVQAGGGYEDGDVLCAFNRRRRRRVHAEHLCHLRDAGFNANGLRPVDSLARHFREATCQYKFRRAGDTTIERIELVTGVTDTFGPESIDVREFITRRRKHARHAVFGAAGQEFWFGGRSDTGPDRLDAVWTAIATYAGRLESEDEFQFWPMGRLDIRHHLPVRVVDFTDDEAAALTGPRHETDRDGNPVLDADGLPIVLAKRNVRVDWRAELLDDLGVTEAQVLDRDFAVGRDVLVAANRLRHESKPQPSQSQRSKLHNKNLGGPIPEGV